MNGKEVNFDINANPLPLSDVKWARENQDVFAEVIGQSLNGERSARQHHPAIVARAEGKRPSNCHRSPTLYDPGLVVTSGVTVGNCRRGSVSRGELYGLQTYFCDAVARVINHVHRFVIYTTCLTDRFMVEGPVEGCAQQYCVPMLKVERLAKEYWQKVEGWPHGAEKQTRFVEGFVRGAAERPAAVRP
jgi:hypothetical protein